MVKLAYIFHAWGNVASIQIEATPPPHPQGLSDAGLTARKRAGKVLSTAQEMAGFETAS